MVNLVTLIGNVGKEPEIRNLDGGLIVASFSLATTESYKNKAGERVKNTEWHNITCWRHLAELAEKYIKKGSKLYIQGKITTRKWEDKDGNTRYTTDIIAQQIQLLDSKPRNEANPPNALTDDLPNEKTKQQSQDSNSEPPPHELEDLPF